MLWLKVIYIKFLTISLTSAIANDILLPNFGDFELLPKFLNLTPELQQNNLQWIGSCLKFPCESTKILYQQTGKFISKNLLGTRGQIDNNILYMTLPRFRNGIPATIVKTNMNNCGCTPVFDAYPTWNAQEEGNCKALQSCIDLVLDKNRILWCLDKGITSSLEDPKKLCKPKIVGINTITDTISHTITLDGIITNKTRLQYLVVDFNDNDDTVLYISDAGNRAIIVYDVTNNQPYRVNLPKVVTDGCTIKDILYLLLVKQSCGTTYLYFTYLGAKKIFSINTEYLKYGNTDDGLITEIGTKPFKSIFIGSDNRQSIYFRREGASQIFKWDTTQQFNQSNFLIVEQNSGCKLATHAFSDLKFNKMYALQSNFPDYFKNTYGCGAVQQLLPIS